MQTSTDPNQQQAVYDNSIYRPLTTQERFTTTITLAPERAERIRATYRYLCISVVAGMAGGWLGYQIEPWVEFMFTWPGWIMAMILLNTIPGIALKASRSSPMTAVGALAATGFMFGMVLAPLIFVAMLLSRGMLGPNLPQQALVITAVIFAAITAYVMKSGRHYSAPRGLMVGIFFAIVGAILVNGIFLHSGLAGTLVSAAIGIFGALTLVYATSSVLHDPEFDDPVYGAMVLFAGLFHVFQAVLHLLLSIAGGSRD
ncbi:MAG: Bax inhibitor-1 family protein [Candidatus Eremiobacterota bacterium]